MDDKSARRRYTEADAVRDARSKAKADEYQAEQEALAQKNMARNRAGMTTESFRLAVPATFPTRAPIPPAKRKSKE